jgi:hypothetical protein
MNGRGRNRVLAIRYLLSVARNFHLLYLLRIPARMRESALSSMQRTRKIFVLEERKLLA